MLFPGAMVLSPGTDSDRGSASSSIVAGGERAAVGAETFGMGEKDDDLGREAAPTGALSPWITTRRGIDSQYNDLFTLSSSDMER